MIDDQFVASAIMRIHARRRRRRMCQGLVVLIAIMAIYLLTRAQFVIQ